MHWITFSLQLVSVHYPEPQQLLSLCALISFHICPLFRRLSMYCFFLKDFVHLHLPSELGMEITLSQISGFFIQTCSTPRTASRLLCSLAILSTIQVLNTRGCE